MGGGRQLCREGKNGIIMEMVRALLVISLAADDKVKSRKRITYHQPGGR